MLYRPDASRGLCVHQNKRPSGFTLLELLIVLGILSILIAAVIIAINPGRQFAQARNIQRKTNIQGMITAIYANLIEHGGTFVCTAGPVPTTATPISSDTGGYDLCPCIIPQYLPVLIVDPSTGTGKDCTSYDSGYTIQRDSAGGRITITSPSAELGETISTTY